MRSVLRVLASGLLVALFCAAAFAQGSQTGGITGVVTDPQRGRSRRHGRYHQSGDRQVRAPRDDRRRRQLHGQSPFQVVLHLQHFEPGAARLVQRAAVEVVVHEHDRQEA